MNKWRNRCWTLFSLLLMLLSIFPLGTLAETKQTAANQPVKELKLMDSAGNPLAATIEPEETIFAQFTLTLEEDADWSLQLPTEILATDQIIFEQENSLISIENNCLKVQNKNGAKQVLKKLSFEFVLSKQAIKGSHLTLNFFDQFSFQVAFKESKEASLEKKTPQILSEEIGPQSGSDKTSLMNNLWIKDIYIVRSGNTKEYIVQNYVPVDPQPTVKVGDGVYFDYTFSVPQSAHLGAGDYIYVDLPEEYFRFSAINNTMPFIESQSNDVIGEISLVDFSGDKKLKITFNDKVAENWNGLSDCYLTAYGIASVETDSGVIEGSESSEYPIVIDPKPGESNPGKPIGDLSTITKNGGTYVNSNQVYWTISLMMDNYKKALEGDTPDFYQNVYLEDQLDESLSNLTYSIYMNIYTVTDDGKMAKDPIGQVQLAGTDGVNTLSPLQLKTQGSLQSNEDFEQEIRNHTYPCYGVTRSNKLVINLRSFPNLTNDRSNGLLLFGNAAGSAKQRIWKVIADAVASEKITAVQGEKTQEAYERYFSHDSGGTYDNYPYGLNIRLNAVTSLGEGSVIENKATVFWENNTAGEEGESNKITINNWGGGATRVPPTTFRLKKMDNDTKVSLKDVEFKLQREKTGEPGVYETITSGVKKTDANGVLLYENLTDGNYRLIEMNNPDPRYTEKLTILPPDGVGEEGIYYFTINSTAAEGIAVSAYNYLAKGKITLIKKDADTGEQLNNAQFTLRKKTGEELVQPQVLLTTGKNYLYQYNDTTSSYELVEDSVPGTKGKITVSGLPLGEYYFQEEAAPDGYTYDDDGKSDIGEISVDGETVSVTRENRPKAGKLKLTKLAPDGSKLNDAEFELYAVAEGTSETKLGTTFVTGKTYTYEYNSVTQKYEFNEKPGVNGELNISGLPLGKYYLKEVQAPEGYKISGDGKTEVKEITEDGVTITYEVTNEVAEGAVTLKKQDGNSNKTLKGTKFKVAVNAAGTTWFADEELEVGDGTTAKGTYKAVKSGSTWSFVLDTSVVTPEGELVITNLPEGIYYFVETKAPDGYVLLQETIKFIITGGQEASTNRLVVDNYPKGTLPETGGNGPWTIIGTGVLLVFAFFLYLMKEKLTRKKAGDGR